MVKKIIIIAIILIGCTKKLYNLSMARVPYIGNELRIDGYYYAYKSYDDYTQIAVFFRNGVCMIMWASKGKTLKDIENEILTNKSAINKNLNSPNHIGVFQIQEEELILEIWENGYEILPFSYYCKILNDTTFQEINQDRSTSSSDLIFHFKHFTPKPDSISPYIK